VVDSAHKILIVDDDPDWREYMRFCLDDLGYHSIEAASGSEALETLRREPCTVMLLDMRMPEMSGEEVIKRLPEDDAPRVVCLTNASAQEVGSALRRGPHYYLPKGASREQLALLLQSLSD
jgi:CheY-like chemotaxis protein